MTNNEIKQLMNDFNALDLTYLSIVTNDVTVKMKKGNQTVMASQPAIIQELLQVPVVKNEIVQESIHKNTQKKN